MQPRIPVITLAVDDLEPALGFYREGLGLESPGIIGTEFEGDDTQPAGTVAMFELHDGLILAVYPRTELAKDAGIVLEASSSGGFSIGHAVPTKGDVDALLARAEQAGATVTQAAPRPSVGHPRRLLPRPGLAPVGGHVEPAARHVGCLKGATPVLRTLTSGLIVASCRGPHRSSPMAGKTQTTHHSRLDDGPSVPSMKVVLTREN
jgi:catechol 2,3-dioxygenase-like lactoylglutathione lyase family enzyme